MKYRGTVYRPPVEASTLLLPVTEGCMHNRCRFCNMYRDVPFRMLALSEVEEGLREIRALYAGHCDRVERIYLVGADPFALSAKNLEERAGLIRKYLPNVKTITMYARVSNITPKTDAELLRLRKIGINDLYVGVECGLNDVMEKLNKGYSADETKAQCLRLNEAGIRHCDLLMLGTGGKGRGLECARASAALENAIKPHKILLNTMTAFVDTPLDRDIQTGAFVPAPEKENLEEEREFLARLDLPDCYFWAVHPLDSVRIEGTMREDKERMLAALERGIGQVDEFAFDRTSRRGTL